MPTKMISTALTGVIGATLMGMPAMAGGNCAGNSCAVPVQVINGAAPQFGPMTIRNENPMGHLSSVNFQRAPNVTITRVHGLGPTASLSDAPSGFTNGCHPTSTTYCRQSTGVPVQVELAPQPRPVQPAPVMAAPVPSEPRIVAIGGGYDPSKFTPRVYGDASFVPGIAHVPTSIVDRDPVRAQQVLDSGRTVAQPVLGRDTFGGTVPHPAHMRQTQSFAVQAPRPVFAAPAPVFTQPRGFAGAPVLQQNGPFAGSYGSSVGADGTYWEKVSGPTSFGDTVATQVICKRQLPTRVVRPVVPVPYPVPVPVKVAPTCAPVPNGLARFESGHGNASRYGANEPGRWVN